MCVAGEHLDPGMNCQTKRSHSNSCEVFWISLQAAQGCSQQGSGPRKIAPLKMMEGSGDLNQGLQERFLGLLRGQPDQFPMFMRREEFAAVKTAHPFSQTSVIPVQ